MRVIVTGATRGIGRGIATFLARDGFRVGLVARTGPLLDELREEIRAGGAEAWSAPCDLRDESSVNAAFTELIAAMGGVDALINNAGLVIRKDVFALSFSEWRDLMATNADGVFLATRAVLPHLRRTGRGHIINVSSISGRLPLAGGSGYAASKYAVSGFSASLFHELRDSGIKVTTIFPGSVDSASHRHGPGDDASWKVRPEEVGKACRDVLESAPGTCISELEIRPLRRPPPP